MAEPSRLPVVFDRALVRARLRRALSQSDQDFLFDRATEDLIGRLEPVQRVFQHPLEIGSPRSGAARALAALWPDTTIIRVAATEPVRKERSWLHIVADEERVALRDGRFDLAVSVLGLQSVNDLPGCLAQIRRTLKPDGLFLAALIGGQSLHELRTVMAQAEGELYGGASPRVAPFSDLRDLGHLLQRAGFALPVTDLDRVVVRYSTMFGLCRDLRAMGATNALVDRRRAPTSRRLFTRAAELYADQFSDPDGRVRATFEIVWLSGWSPHESQQKPLRPGSAKMRLGEALRVPEWRIDSAD